VSLPGYKPYDETWEIRPGFSRGEPVRLSPLPARLQIVSYLSDISLLVDGEPKDSLVPGVPLDLPNLPLDAQHTLQFSLAGRLTDVPFRAAVGKAPEIHLPAGAAPPIAAVAVFGSAGRFQSSIQLKVSVDGGQTYRDAGPDGVDLPQLPADGVLTIQEGSGPARTLVLAQDAAPTLLVFLLSPTPTVAMGSLAIDVPDANFVLLIDGKHVQFGRKGPPFLAYNLPEGVHKVSIQKAGYRVDPEFVSATVRANGRTPVKFNLAPMAPRLSVRGGVPGTRLTVGSQTLTLDSSGDLAAVEIQPGAYELTFSKPGYHSATMRRTFSLGADVSIGAPESRIKPITGTVRITGEVGEPGLRIQITQKQGLVPMEGSGAYENPPAGPIVLPVGKYEIVFSAPGFKPQPVTFGLTDSQDLRIPVDPMEKQ
jgi:hypothetical protein